MSLMLLIPLSILMGLVGLCAFFWALRSGQFDDPEGDAWRVLDAGAKPLSNRPRPEGDDHD